MGNLLPFLGIFDLPIREQYNPLPQVPPQNISDYIGRGVQVKEKLAFQSRTKSPSLVEYQWKEFLLMWPLKMLMRYG